MRRPIQLLKAATPTGRLINRTAAKVLKEMRQNGIDAIQERLKDSSEIAVKYLEVDWHVRHVVREAARLNLLSSPPLRVLDIGCGTGSFLYVLRSVGHKVFGLDLGDSEVYNEMIEFLKLPRIIHRISKFQRLPEFEAKLDLITAYSVCFDMHHCDEVWGPEEWAFFLMDCQARLKSGGRIFLNFNPATNQPFDFIPDSVAEMLRNLPGARLSASREFFTLHCA